MGTYSKYIKWYQGISAAALAGVMVVAIGTGTAAALLASCGATVMGVIAAGSIGGTLYWTKWNYNTQTTNYKVDWAFKTPNGERYGTYHYYYSYK